MKNKKMQFLSTEEFRSILDTALLEKICVQTWLGYASVLFIGFGESVIERVPSPTHTKTRKHSLPPYELQTQLSDWWIEAPEGTTGMEDDRTGAEEMASRLLGRRVTQWRYLQPLQGIRIQFEGELNLSIQPYVGPEYQGRDAWSVRTIDGHYATVTCGGDLYICHGSEAI